MIVSQDGEQWLCGYHDCLMNGCYKQHRKSGLYKDVVADAPNLNDHMQRKFSPQ